MVTIGVLQKELINILNGSVNNNTENLLHQMATYCSRTINLLFPHCTGETVLKVLRESQDQYQNFSILHRYQAAISLIDYYNSIGPRPRDTNDVPFTGHLNLPNKLVDYATVQEKIFNDQLDRFYTQIFLVLDNKAPIKINGGIVQFCTLHDCIFNLFKNLLPPSTPLTHPFGIALKTLPIPQSRPSQPSQQQPQCNSLCNPVTEAWLHYFISKDRHPVMLPLLHTRTTNDKVMMVSQYCNGGTLLDILKLSVLSQLFNLHSSISQQHQLPMDFLSGGCLGDLSINFNLPETQMMDQTQGTQRCTSIHNIDDGGDGDENNIKSIMLKLIAHQSHLNLHEQHPNVQQYPTLPTQILRQPQLKTLQHYFLTQLYRELAPKIRSTLDIIYDLSHGLDYLHNSLGVAHLDIKPENIFLVAYKKPTPNDDYNFESQSTKMNDTLETPKSEEELDIVVYKAYFADFGFSHVMEPSSPCSHSPRDDRMQQNIEQNITKYHIFPIHNHLSSTFAFNQLNRYIDEAHFSDRVMIDAFYSPSNSTIYHPTHLPSHLSLPLLVNLEHFNHLVQSYNDGHLSDSPWKFIESIWLYQPTPSSPEQHQQQPISLQVRCTFDPNEDHTRYSTNPLDYGVMTPDVNSSITKPLDYQLHPVPFGTQQQNWFNFHQYILQLQTWHIFQEQYRKYNSHVDLNERNNNNNSEYQKMLDLTRQQTQVYLNQVVFLSLVTTAKEVITPGFPLLHSDSPSLPLYQHDDSNPIVLTHCLPLPYYSYLSQPISSQLHFSNYPTQPKGTVPYMSPELHYLYTKDNTPPTLYDPFKADVYSLGIVFFILLFGFHPYLTQSGFHQDVFHQHFTLSYLSCHDPSLPPAVRQKQLLQQASIPPSELILALVEKQLTHPHLRFLIQILFIFYPDMIDMIGMLLRPCPENRMTIREVISLPVISQYQRGEG